MTDTKKSGKRILSRTYRAGAREEPPERLDGAILAAARQAVGAPSKARGPFGPRWTVPLSVAAVVTLSVGLVVFMDREGNVPWRTESPIAPVMPPEPVMAMKRAATERPVADADGTADGTKEIVRIPAPESVATGGAPAAPTVPKESAAVRSRSGTASTPALISPPEKSEAKVAAASENLLGSVGRAQSPPAPPAPIIQLRVGERIIRAEVASTPEARRRGLMFRESLASDAGMLFVFSEDDVVCLWMKNTNVPLSAAFVDNAGKVLNIADMQPQSERLHCATGRARYVLEVNQGVLTAAGVKPGVQIGGLPGAR